MNFLADFKFWLEQTTAVNAYPNNRPETVAPPAIVYQVVSTTRPRSHSGDSKVPTKRVQLNIFATSALVAESTGDALVAAMESGRFFIRDLPVTKAHVSNDFMDYDADTQYHRRVLDVLITYREA